MCLCAGKAGCTGGSSNNFSVGGVDSVSSCRQDTANRESMHTEGRPHPRCAERALTAHTLSGFSLALRHQRNPQLLILPMGRGNGIFIRLSSTGGLLPLIMH